MLPQFMDEVNHSKVFQTVDVDLKVNKPELRITIDRAKAARLGFLPHKGLRRNRRLDARC